METMEPMMAVIATILQQSPSVIHPSELVSFIERMPVDMVVIDIQQHTTDVKLIRAIKERNPCIQVVAIVPYGDITLVEQLIESGTDDYISQPISLERLKTTLRNALRHHNLLVNASAEQRAMLNYTSQKPAPVVASFFSQAGKLKTLREIEDMVIEHAIQTYAGCITKAARELGIGRSTLYRKMQERTQASVMPSRQEPALDATRLPLREKV